jgi:hypothetical protein
MCSVAVVRCSSGDRRALQAGTWRLLDNEVRGTEHDEDSDVRLLDISIILAACPGVIGLSYDWTLEIMYS